MTNSTLTLQALNVRNREFWDERNRLLLRRINDEGLVAIARASMEINASRHSLESHTDVEALFAGAEKIKREFLQAISRKGGSNRKTDSLQALILKIVTRTPDIDQRSLFFEVRAEVGKGVVLKVDREQIQFVNYSGKPKTVPVSGLKDRLFRAKRQIKSREPGWRE